MCVRGRKGAGGGGHTKMLTISDSLLCSYIHVCG